MLGGGEEIGNIMVDSEIESLGVDVEGMDFLKDYFHYFLKFFLMLHLDPTV